VPIVLAEAAPLNSRFRDLLTRAGRLDCRPSRAFKRAKSFDQPVREGGLR
jgi:hypothetical protein